MFHFVVQGMTQILSPVLLSKMIGGPGDRYIPEEKLSSKCEIFADAERMTVVGLMGADKVDTDLALAWGLAYRGDRALSLLLPVSREVPSQIRLPWIQPQVRLFTYDETKVCEVPPLSQKESLGKCKDNSWSGPTPHSLDELGELIRPLLGWLDSAPGLTKTGRGSYVAWHAAGRQVMKITKNKSSLTLAAGIDSKKPIEGREPVKIKISDRLTDNEYHLILSAVTRATSDRLGGSDVGHGEHRLQSKLKPNCINLESWQREFPALRYGSSRGFIDFLGVDSKSRMHIVETKIGPDTMLVFQGLDYWLWCVANIDDVSKWFNSKSTKLPIIDFVVAPTEPGREVISIYTAAQLESLDRKIKWAFSIVAVQNPENATTLPPLQIPTPHRRASGTPPRWRNVFLEQAAIAAKASGAKMRGTNMFANPEEMLVPAALPIYQKLKKLGLIHNAASSVNSSQTFALNLFAPLTTVAWTQIARHCLADDRAEVTGVAQFEYVDPEDVLRESSRRSKHVTQVDCMVPVIRGDGTSHMMLIEVKLTEDGFSKCSAFDSSRNDRKHVCATPLAFGGAPGQCFQLANHDKGQRRRYDIALGDLGAQPAGFGCWFRDGGNQIMRNVALARTMIQSGKVKSASVLLMAPEQHLYIWEQWRTHTRVFSNVEGITFGDLLASQVLAQHGDDTRQRLTDQYFRGTSNLASHSIPKSLQ